MAEATTTALTPADDIMSAADRATGTLVHSTRRIWLVGLGIAGVAADQVRAAFDRLEHRGEELEPSVTAPFKRAAHTAGALTERAGASVRTIGDAVSNAASPVADVSRWFKGVDVDQVGRIVEEKISAALERLDLPTREDLQGLTERIEELASKGKRVRESHSD